MGRLEQFLVALEEESIPFQLERIRPGLIAEGPPPGRSMIERDHDDAWHATITWATAR